MKNEHKITFEGPEINKRNPQFASASRHLTFIGGDPETPEAIYSDMGIAEIWRAYILDLPRESIDRGYFADEPRESDFWGE
jgi:hypothetical protein